MKQKDISKRAKQQTGEECTRAQTQQTIKEIANDPRPVDLARIIEDQKLTIRGQATTLDHHQKTIDQQVELIENRDMTIKRQDTAYASTQVTVGTLSEECTGRKEQNDRQADTISNLSDRVRDSVQQQIEKERDAQFLIREELVEEARIARDEHAYAIKQQRGTIDGMQAMIERQGNTIKQITATVKEQRSTIENRQEDKPVAPPSVSFAEHNDLLGDLFKLLATASRAREHLAKERAVLRYGLERLMKAAGKTLDARAIAGSGTLVNDDLYNAHRNAQLMLERPSETKEPAA